MSKFRFELIKCAYKHIKNYFTNPKLFVKIKNELKYNMEFL